MIEAELELWLPSMIIIGKMVNRCLGPLGDDIGDLGTSENMENAWCDIANNLGIGGVGMNDNPHNNGVESASDRCVCLLNMLHE